MRSSCASHGRSLGLMCKSPIARSLSSSLSALIPPDLRQPYQTFPAPASFIFVILRFSFAQCSCVFHHHPAIFPVSFSRCISIFFDAFHAAILAVALLIGPALIFVGPSLLFRPIPCRLFRLLLLLARQFRPHRRLSLCQCILYFLHAAIFSPTVAEMSIEKRIASK